ncbi:hypothetical protein [Bdellovibrio sp. KM01]|uniref:hypothetical protein n=1 Tax=Bdellovibrio sp. KM01 TaxID=2748865 RepID=UPI0015EAF0A3|nr:hypothetical protein [Bdellovibrio sp. KM01]QLY24200.1 hypothetical protein HW988_12075 [Bdellovibrio sp. KM01]
MLENILNSENLPEANPARDLYRESLLQFHSLLEKPRSIKGDYPGLAFDRLPSEAQGPIANALAEWVEFFQMHSTGERISDKQFLWRFLSAFRLKTHPDFFSSVDDETSFEVVNTEGHQTFRSISLMDCCSYSLDELVSIPWYELFSRDQSITDKYLQFQEATTNGTLVHTNVENIIPVHLVTENFGFDKMVLTMKPLYLSPIYDMDDNVVGVISAIKILNYVSRREESKERVRAELSAIP